MTQYIFELLGTLALVLLGDGVCAAVTLNKSKAQGAGWVVITLAWGFAVMVGVLIAGPVSGAHLNPAVSLGLAIAGGFLGACLVYVFYKDQYKATADKPADMLGTFCTMPAVWNPWRNFLCELIATALLVFVILCLGTKGNANVGMGSLGAFPVTCVIMSIGMSLGATTGYAMNPARDLSPRLAPAILPIEGKGSSGWGYSWVPVAGPLAGGAIAAALFMLVF